MSLKELQARIEKKEARLAVIGLGYVGLPVAARFAQMGFQVLGVDVQEDRIKRINAGQSPIEGEEPGLQELLSEVIGSGKLRATSQYAELKDCEVILIDVETPVGEDHRPQYKALRKCLESLAPVLRDGALVIVESTIAPGTMDEVVLPLLEEGSRRSVNEGLFLGCCPERVMPGKLLENLRTLSRVVGGMSDETSHCMTSLYRQIVEGDLDAADCVTAELVKTTENAYRDVQIAFANEVALISEAVGGDVWKVRELVNKSPGRNMLLPGAGVGGHCIPKDPWLLAYGAEGTGVPIRLIPAARAINDSMPGHIVELLENALKETGRNLKGAHILVMGYAYLENSDDTRNSPSATLVEELERRGAQAMVHDPYVKEFQGDLLAMAKGCDAAVLMVKHDSYLALDLPALRRSLKAGVFISGRQIYAPASSAESRIGYRQLGTAVDF